MDVEHWIIKQQVQEASHRYAHFCDVGDVANLVSLFTEDAVLDETAVGAPVVKGHAALTEFFETAIPRNTSLFHLSGNYIIDVINANSATSVHYQFYEGIRADRPDETRIIKGMFYEEFVRQGREWKIALKRLTLLSPVQWTSARQNASS